MIRIDGSADIQLLLATDTQVLCSLSVSGAEPEVISLDARNGKVQWRFKSKLGSGDCIPDAAGHFYFFAGNTLQKRELKSGRSLWQTQLDKIPEQITPMRRSASEYLKELVDNLRANSWTLPARNLKAPNTTKPNHYTYKTVVADSRVTIFRHAVDSAGCIVTPCFSDWIVFDVKSGRKTAGGSGDILGCTDSVTLIQNDSDHYFLKNGELNFVDLDLGDTVHADPFDFTDRDVQISAKSRFLFSNSDCFGTNIFLFDAASGRTTSFRVTEERDYQTRWVVLDKYLLRYTECIAHSARSGVSLSPWFELYSFTGQRVARKEPAALAQAATRDDSWYFRFHAVDPKGNVIFADSPRYFSIGIPNLEARVLSGEQPAKGGIDRVYHPVRGVKVIYELTGDIWLQEMEHPEQKHVLAISATDFLTEKLLWKHNEPVVIKKREQN